MLSAAAASPICHLTTRRASMSAVEKIELARYHREIVEDIRHMLKKYHRIMEWDVPEVDESESRELWS
jgi:hypothetical protein